MYQRPNPVPAKRLTRRQALRMGTALTAGTVAAGTLATAPGQTAVQFDSTPPAPPAPTFSSAVNPITDLAARLDYDRDAIFAFVRDEIHYETYAGVLRGAKGTLWARAGNSADQSALLAMLLQASQIPYRFAVGPLSAEARTELDALVSPTRETLQENLDAKTAAAYGVDARLSDAAPPSDAVIEPAAQALMDATATTAEATQALAPAWFGEMSSILETALDDAGIALPEAVPSIPLSEVDRHVWIQVPEGPEWVALDPTFGGDLKTGAASDTFDILPVEMAHTVRFRIVVEEVRGGALQQRDAVTKEFTSNQLVNLPISFMVAPSDGLESLGEAINRLFEGSLSFNPVIVYGASEELSSVPIVFQSGEPSTFGAFDEVASDGAPGEGETTALWYAVDVISPGQEPITVQRPWIDRIGPELRLQPDFDLSQIPPAETVTRDDGSITVAGLDTITILSVDVARLPLQTALDDQFLSDTLVNTNTLGPSYTALRDVMAVDLEWERGIRSWIASPQVIAFTFSSEDPASTTAPLVLSADLLVRSPATSAIANISQAGVHEPDLHPAVVAGIVDQVTERMLLDPAIWSLDPNEANASLATVNGVHVGRIFGDAVERGIGIRAITTVAELEGLEVGAVSAASIRQSLEANLIIVIPEQPVDIDGEARTGWWIIDPLTGATRDRMDTGGGSVTARLPVRGRLYAGPILEYVKTWAASWWGRVEAYKCLAAIIAAVVATKVVTSLEPGPNTPWVQGGAASSAAAGVVGGCALV